MNWKYKVVTSYLSAFNIWKILRAHRSKSLSSWFCLLFSAPIILYVSLSSSTNS